MGVRFQDSRADTLSSSLFRPCGPVAVALARVTWRGGRGALARVGGEAPGVGQVLTTAARSSRRLWQTPKPGEWAVARSGERVMVPAPSSREAGAGRDRVIAMGRGGGEGRGWPGARASAARHFESLMGWYLISMNLVIIFMFRPCF